jgi:acyl-CoA synthetase (AMP-forming)/AMP-acid ligase II
VTNILHNLGDILRLPALGNRLAYVDLRPGRPIEFTAIELDRLIVSVARGLVRRGIRVGERVGIVAENRFEFIATYLGAMRLGAVAVPINFKLPAGVIQHVFRDSEIRFAFTDSQRAPQIPAGIPAIDFDFRDGADFQAFLDPGPLNTYAPRDDDLAEILYTSGSTGLPKGVPLTHRGQLAALSNYCDPLDESLAQHTALIVAPLYHMNGLFFSTVALTNRITVISLPRFEARRYLETVTQYRCTVLSGIPTMFALAVRERARVP